MSSIDDVELRGAALHETFVGYVIRQPDGFDQFRRLLFRSVLNRQLVSELWTWTDVKRSHWNRRQLVLRAIDRIASRPSACSESLWPILHSLLVFLGQQHQLLHLHLVLIVSLRRRRLSSLVGLPIVLRLCQIVGPLISFLLRWKYDHRTLHFALHHQTLRPLIVFHSLKFGVLQRYPIGSIHVELVRLGRSTDPETISEQNEVPGLFFFPRLLQHVSLPDKHSAGLENVEVALEPVVHSGHFLRRRQSHFLIHNLRHLLQFFDRSYRFPFLIASFHQIFRVSQHQKLVSHKVLMDLVELLKHGALLSPFENLCFELKIMVLWL